MAGVVQAVCFISILITSTANTEVIPKTGPKKAPAIGPKKSKRVKETLDPANLLKGICKLIKPTVVKRAKNSNCFCSFFIYATKDNLTSLVCQ